MATRSESISWKELIGYSSTGTTGIYHTLDMLHSQVTASILKLQSPELD